MRKKTYKDRVKKALEMLKKNNTSKNVNASNENIFNDITHDLIKNIAKEFGLNASDIKFVRINLDDLNKSDFNINEILQQKSPYEEFIENKKQYCPDSILDKISANGISSLTVDEINFLKNHSESL